MRLNILLIIMVLSFSSCQTASTIKNDNESTKEVEGAVEAVAGALAGKDLTPEEKENLKKQIKDDPQARSAIESISSAVSVPGRRIKYSPATGKRYASHLEFDPETGVKLQWLEE